MGNRMRGAVAAAVLTVTGSIGVLIHNAAPYVDNAAPYVDNAAPYVDDAAKSGRWTIDHPPGAIKDVVGHLDPDDAKDVIEAACKLSKQVLTDTSIDQRAHQYYGPRYGEDKLRTLVDLTKKARQNAEVEAFCDWAG